MQKKTPLIRCHGVVCEMKVAIRAAGIAAGLVMQHLDQVPVQAAVVIAQGAGLAPARQARHDAETVAPALD